MEVFLESQAFGIGLDVLHDDQVEKSPEAEFAVFDLTFYGEQVVVYCLSELYEASYRQREIAFERGVCET
ncbi:hypothetical protein IA69_19155 [Massilia sp. JS1662]|nr:hypothetical protein IA69_19155 [Massilia sp. JS1662]